MPYLRFTMELDGKHKKERMEDAVRLATLERTKEEGLAGGPTKWDARPHINTEKPVWEVTWRYKK